MAAAQLFSLTGHMIILIRMLDSQWLAYVAIPDHVHRNVRVKI